MRLRSSQMVALTGPGGAAQDWPRRRLKALDHEVDQGGSPVSYPSPEPSPSALPEPSPVRENAEVYPSVENPDMDSENVPPVRVIRDRQEILKFLLKGLSEDEVQNFLDRADDETLEDYENLMDSTNGIEGSPTSRIENEKNPSIARRKRILAGEKAK